MQEASVSEEDEDDESCHSSSSDTLTGSVPEVNLQTRPLGVSFLSPLNLNQLLHMPCAFWNDAEHIAGFSSSLLLPCGTSCMLM